MCNFYAPKDFLRDGVTSVDITTLPECDRECTICYDRFALSTEDVLAPASFSDLRPEPPIRITACNHIFGERCLRDHVNGGFSYSSACPMCRRSLFEFVSIDEVIRRYQNDMSRSQELERQCYEVTTSITTAQSQDSADLNTMGVAQLEQELSALQYEQSDVHARMVGLQARMRSWADAQGQGYRDAAERFLSHTEVQPDGHLVFVWYAVMLQVGDELYGIDDW